MGNPVPIVCISHLMIILRIAFDILLGVTLPYEPSPSIRLSVGWLDDLS